MAPIAKATTNALDGSPLGPRILIPGRDGKFSPPSKRAARRSW